jgi:hypothetical protein
MSTFRGFLSQITPFLPEYIKIVLKKPFLIKAESFCCY